MKRDVAGLDLPLLRALTALVNESGVTRAAQSLGIGQPAMSGQLKRLREVLGDAILVRGGGGSKPTVRALELAASVDDILERVGRLAMTRHAVSSPSEMELTVTITATDYARQLFLDQALPRIREEAPGIRLAFQRPDRDRVREWMEQGSVDLGLGASAIPTGRLRSRRLYRDVPCCVAARGVMPPTLTLDAYSAMPHVMVRPARASEVDTLVDARMHALGRRRDIVITIPDFAGAIDAVRNAPLLATLPRGGLRRVGDAWRLDVRSLPFTLPDVPISMYWHDRTDRSVPHKWLRGVIVEAFRSFAP